MEVDSEILSLLSKLGHRDLNEDGSEVFQPEKRPVKTLKDIRRILNKDIDDDDDFSSRSLADVHAIRQHLIPLLLSCENHDQGDAVVDELTKLFVLLTLPDTPCHEAHASELRLAFTEFDKIGQSALLILASRVENALTVDASKRGDNDRKRVDLLLYLLRNLLLPSAGSVGRADFLMQMEKDAIYDILLHFTAHVGRKNNREWNLLLLDIFFNLFRGISPDATFRFTGAPGHGDNDLVSNEERTVPANRKQGPLSEILGQLQEKKRLTQKILPTRHSSFGGVLQVIQEGDVRLVSSLHVNASSGVLGQGAQSGLLTTRKRRIQDASVVSRDILLSKQDELLLSNDIRRLLAKVASELLERAYAPLFACLIQDFRREDSRIKQDDEIRFVWMLCFFTRYARQFGEWTQTSVKTTMDLWSFLFIVNKITNSLETKSWASLETGLGALLEMVLNLKVLNDDDESKALKNAVFYELRERLEIIPRLLKLWEPSVLSRVCLSNLAQLGDAVLDIIEDMADEGALAKAKIKDRLKAERKQKNMGVFNLTWTSEETYALSEGVKGHRGEYDLQTMRSILRDPAIGPVFEDQKRTPQQLVARWMQIREALASGKTLDQFVKDDLARVIDEDKEVENEVANEKPELFEKQVDFNSALRSYLSNNVYRNLTRLIDPAQNPDGDSAVFREKRTLALVTKFFRRIRAFRKGLKSDESLEPLLWHVEILDSWYRFLSLAASMPSQNLPKEANDLANLMLSSIRRMMRLMKETKPLFIEILFWRTKHDNIILSKGHKKEKNRRNFANTSAFAENHEEELQELEGHSSEDSDAESAFSGGSIAGKLSKSPLKVTVSESKARSGPKQTLPLSKRPPRRAPKVKSEIRLNEERLRAVIRKALRSGINLAPIMAVIEAFESAVPGVEDYPFFPPADEDACTNKDMVRLFLALGMRPPKRSLITRAKNPFACETYWRIPTSVLSKAELLIRAETMRTAVASGGSEVENDEESDVDWCISDNEASQKARKNDESDEFGDDSDKSSEESEEESRASQSAPESPERPVHSPRVRTIPVRRVVHSSSEDESESEDEDEKANRLDERLDEVPVEEWKSDGLEKKRRRIVSDDD